MSKHNSQKGFTLIEILIVIAIIGVLASIVLVGLGPVQRRGRDARRISDLREVQNALELYFSKCGHYPGPAAAALADCGYSAITTWADLTTSLRDSSLGVNQVPNDPTANTNYLYGSNGSGYVLGANLEDSENPALRDSIGGSVHGIDCSVANTYCIQF